MTRRDVELGAAVVLVVLAAVVGWTPTDVRAAIAAVTLLAMSVPLLISSVFGQSQTRPGGDVR
jgi:hypothetical protein